MSAPFLTADKKPTHRQALAAVRRLDDQVREIANQKRKPGNLSTGDLATVFEFVRGLVDVARLAKDFPPGGGLTQCDMHEDESI